MCTSAIFGRIAVGVVIVVGCVFSAKSQTPPPNSDKASTIIELLNNIKSAVQKGRYKNPEEVYKSVSIRLGQCAIAHGKLSKNPDIEQLERTVEETASSVFFRAATVLYPGDTQSFMRELKESIEAFVQLRSDKKAQLYFLRNCRDFTEASSVAGAVREVFP